MTCLLVGAAIFVSRMGVAQDIQVVGQRSLAPGEPGAVRVLVYSDDGQMAYQVEVTLWLVRGERSEELAAARAAPGLPAVDIEFTVPEWDAGPATLRAEIHSALGREVIDAPVELSDDPPALEYFLPPPPGDRASSVRTQGKIPGDDATIELLPYGGPALVPNLDNVLFVRTTTDGGVPAPRTLRLELVAGTLEEELPQEVQTDPLGVALIPLRPQTNELVLRVVPLEGAPPARGPVAADAGPPAAADASTDGGVDAEADAPAAPEELILGVPTTPAQLVQRHRSPVPMAGEPLDVLVESLHASRPLYTDVFSAKRLLSTNTSHLAKNWAKAQLSAVPSGVVLIQSYATPVAVGRAYSAHHLYGRGLGESEPEVLRSIAAAVRLAKVDSPYVDVLLDRDLLSNDELRFERTAAFLLSRLDRGYLPPDRLVASMEVRSESLGQFQSSFRTYISVGIALIGLVVAFLLAYAFTVAAYRNRQRRLLWEQETGANEDDLYVTSMGRPKGLDRFRLVVQIALMVGVVAVGFILIAVLVSVMRWQA